VVLTGSITITNIGTYINIDTITECGKIIPMVLSTDILPVNIGNGIGIGF
jgi:hypothetical protein